MIIEMFVGLFLFLSLITFNFIRDVFKSNSKKIELKNGSFPQKSGKYYIILDFNNKKIATVDNYNADSMQWINTKNPLKITHFAEY